jgi:hypothetical protein
MLPAIILGNYARSPRTRAAAAFEAVHAALSPLRSAGLLATWTHALNSTRPVPGLLTVVGTGSTPISSVRALGLPGAPPRDVFLDASLGALPSDAGPALCPLASMDLRRAVLPSTHAWAPWFVRWRVRELAGAAHRKGVAVRFWGTPRGQWARCVLGSSLQG